jgi:hypothetical protein
MNVYKKKYLKLKKEINELEEQIALLLQENNIIQSHQIYNNNQIMNINAEIERLHKEILYKEFHEPILPKEKKVKIKEEVIELEEEKKEEEEEEEKEEEEKEEEEKEEEEKEEEEKEEEEKEEEEKEEEKEEEEKDRLEQNRFEQNLTDLEDEVDRSFDSISDAVQQNIDDSLYLNQRAGTKESLLDELEDVLQITISDIDKLTNEYTEKTAINII